MPHGSSQPISSRTLPPKTCHRRHAQYIAPHHLSARKQRRHIMQNFRSTRMAFLCLATLAAARPALAQTPEPASAAMGPVTFTVDLIQVAKATAVNAKTLKVRFALSTADGT